LTFYIVHCTCLYDHSVRKSL